MVKQRAIDSITISPKSAKATVHTRLDQTFLYFVEETATESTDQQSEVDAHVKLVVWGALYFEALTNHKLRTITTLVLAGHERMIEPMWQLSRQARLDDKVAAVFALDGAIRPTLKVQMTALARFLELRNRIVHFKDVPTEFDFSEIRKNTSKNADLKEWFVHAPDTKIVKELCSQSLTQRKKFILDFGQMIERIR